MFHIMLGKMDFVFYINKTRKSEKIKKINKVSFFRINTTRDSFEVSQREESAVRNMSENENK